MGGFNSAWFLGAAITLFVGGLALPRLTSGQQTNVAVACIVFGCASFMIGIANFVIGVVPKVAPATENPNSDLSRVLPAVPLETGAHDCVELSRIAISERVQIAFTSSRLFEDPARRCRIRAQISNFHTYLTRVGFDLPTSIPPLSTTSGKAIVMAFEVPGTLYDAQLRIPEDSVDDEEAVLNIYALWVFRIKFLKLHGSDDSEPAASLFSCYYRSSAIDKNLCGIGWECSTWADALWAIRKAKTPDFCDRAMLSTFNRWDEPVQQNQPFSALFLSKFLRGVSTIDYLRMDSPSVVAILQSRGLMNSSKQ